MKMITIPMYQVDAFTDKLFEGNPAAICIMDREVPDHILQSIALENNLAETAFLWEESDGFRIRWFTPTIEVDLCGHATLASAYILFKLQKSSSLHLRFESKSGPLFVHQSANDMLELDFPCDSIVVAPCPDYLPDALHCEIIECIRGKTDYMVRIQDEATLQTLKPDFQLIAKLPSRGLIVTAPGDKVDFVSRCFFPQSGIDEDPVTGSAHTTLTPFWAGRLNKSKLFARQLSARGGMLTCVLKEDLVLIGGHAVLYLEGQIHVSL